MKRTQRWLAGCAAGLALASVSQTAPAGEAGGYARVIVRLKDSATAPRALAFSAGAAQHPRKAQALTSRAGVTLADGLAIDRRTQVVKAVGMSSQALAEKLAADPDVESAVVDHRVYPLAAPNDPLYANGQSETPSSGQWYLRAPDATLVSAVNAEAAWDVTSGRSSTVVALVDTGFLLDHPDLEGKLLPGYDFVNDEATANDGDGRDDDPSDPGDWLTFDDLQSPDFDGESCPVRDSLWHGTGTAGLVGAATDNNIGVAGLAPGVRILPVRALGKCGGFASDIQAAMRWAAGLDVPSTPSNPNPARVVNLSIGSDETTCSTEYQRVVDELAEAGVVVVAAAGNIGEAVGRPANCSGVIGVAGLTHRGTKASYSSLGSRAFIAAPGGSGNFTLTMPGNTGTTTPQAHTYTTGSLATQGTSFAAPLVAGTIGLMLSVRPKLTIDQINGLLQSTARSFPSSGAGAGVSACRSPDEVETQEVECYCTTSTCGAGMLDTAAAVEASTQALAGFTVSPASPTEGDTVTLDGGASVAKVGGRIGSYQWRLTSGDAIADLLADEGEVVRVKTSGGGTFSVRLTITDAATGATSVASKTISVAAIPSDDDEEEGSGAASPVWLLLLGAAVASLLPRRQRRA